MKEIKNNNTSIKISNNLLKLAKKKFPNLSTSAIIRLGLQYLLEHGFNNIPNDQYNDFENHVIFISPLLRYQLKSKFPGWRLQDLSRIGLELLIQKEVG